MNWWLKESRLDGLGGIVDGGMEVHLFCRGWIYTYVPSMMSRPSDYRRSVFHVQKLPVSVGPRRAEVYPECPDRYSVVVLTRAFAPNSLAPSSSIYWVAKGASRTYLDGRQRGRRYSATAATAFSAARAIDVCPRAEFFVILTLRVVRVGSIIHFKPLGAPPMRHQDFTWH